MRIDFNCAQMIWVVFVSMFVTATNARMPDHIYQLKEEAPLHQVLGYLNQDIARFRGALASSISASEVRNYRILNDRDPGVVCFSLEPNSSRLSVRSRVDREALCPTEGLSAGTRSSGTLGSASSRCSVTLKVAIKGIDQFATITIEVLDINDHSPQWPLTRLTVEFHEGEPAGSRKSLVPARDADSGENGELRYSLESMSSLSSSSSGSRSGISSADSFTLVQEHGLYLQTARPLDREVTAEYSLVLLATDRGSPPHLARLELLVRVLDINDNAPRFTSALFRPEKQLALPETTPVGSIVLRLTATDPDADTNGEFSFGFADTDTSTARGYFSVRPNGEIIVQRQLDFDLGQHKFEFKVIVRDHASSGYERSSESRVEIAISDENDESPEVRVYPIVASTDHGGGIRGGPNSAVIEENRAPASVIALVHAVDRDFSKTDSVSCSLLGGSSTNSRVSLAPTSEPTEYKLVTTGPLDRETEARFSVSVECHDPADHRSFANISVEVADVNDNAPQFSAEELRLHVRENLPLGSPVEGGRISAVDRDAGANARVSYTIIGTDNVNSPQFTVDPSSGLLRTGTRLDRESVVRHSLSVRACDAGQPPMCATSTVMVLVEDENDNPVTLEPATSLFRVQENLPARAEVGTVPARDADNQTIFFFLEPINDASLFTIHRTQGLIMTKKSLDRERQAEYRFRLFATDRLYTASLSLTVTVVDANDNSPVFVMPNSTHNSISVSRAEAAGHNLGRIQAVDPDDQDNARISYSIRRHPSPQHTSAGLFSIDRDSGVLYLDSSLLYETGSIVGDQVSLGLQACDNGRPARCTEFPSFRVYLLDKSGTGGTGSGSEQTGSSSGGPRSRGRGYNGLDDSASGMGENIIVALIVFLLLMIVGTVLVILLLRRRIRHHRGNQASSGSSSQHQKSAGQSRKDALHSGQQNHTHYFQSKLPMENDQCSAEICEITSRLSPDQENTKNLITNAPYYHLADQYQTGPFLPFHCEQTYQMPMMHPQQHFPPVSNQPILLKDSCYPVSTTTPLLLPEQMGYYSKYEVEHKPPNSMEIPMSTTIAMTPPKSATLTSSVGLSASSPKTRKGTQSTAHRKPHSSFV